MARFTGPKRKLSRREGIPLFPKDVKYMERKVAATLAGRPSRRRVSEYGLQLREKQKAKRLFGILEKQFHKYYEMSSKGKGSTGAKLLEFLEIRLDNLVYKLGFAASRNQARQYITHGHINVDGKKMSIPSYLVKVGQTIALSPQIVDNIQVKNALEQSSTLPEWLDRKATVGKVLRMPKREEMEQSISEQLIVEYYSR